MGRRVICPRCGQPGTLYRHRRGYWYVAHWDREAKRPRTCYIGPAPDRPLDKGPSLSSPRLDLRAERALEYCEALLGELDPSALPDPGRAGRRLRNIARLALFLLSRLEGGEGPKCPRCGLPGRPVLKFDHRGVEGAKRTFCHVGALRAWLLEDRTE